MRERGSLVNTTTVEKLKTYGATLAGIGLVMLIWTAIQSEGDPNWNLYVGAFVILDIGVMMIVIAILIGSRLKRRVELEKKQEKDNWL